MTCISQLFVTIYFEELRSNLLMNIAGRINTLSLRQNGRHFADDIFKCIFLNQNVLNFIPRGRINNTPALARIMALCRGGDKPLSEPMMVCLLTHICVIRPQWVNLRRASDERNICIWDLLAHFVRLLNSLAGAVFLSSCYGLTFEHCFWNWTQVNATRH